MGEVFEFCSDYCLSRAKEGENLMLSSADAFAFCGICGNYGQSYKTKSFNVKLIETEECDCFEKHGRILHNNGGNYHISEYEQIK